MLFVRLHFLAAGYFIVLFGNVFQVIMPKNDFLTPKAIANRIKSKGLQKLRWYCQMCQKQCRDENGFKCHLMSESHQRQMMLVADNPNKYLDAFSEEFLSDFLDLLRRRFGTKRVNNNQVYNEYIQFKEHIHMNSTKWVTLSEFTKWLGREGYCHVDETPKGWFIAYIDRDSEAMKKQEALKIKEKMDYTDEERNQKFIEQQMILTSSKPARQIQPTELVRENDDEKIQIKLNNKPIISNPSNDLPAAEKVENPLKRNSDSKKPIKSKSKPKSALQEIMEEGLKSKKQKMEIPNEDEFIEDTADDKWLTEGLIVKITTKRLGDKYYKQKVKVIELISDYIATVQLVNELETKIKLDAIHVETVIPVPGKKVKFVKGKLKGKTATVEEIREKDFCVRVRLDNDVLQVPYENVCKFD